MNTKLLILVFILIIVAIILTIMRSGSLQRQEQATSQQITDTQTPMQNNRLYIARISDPSKIFSVIDQLTVTFSKPVDESTIFIDFEPEATISAILDDTKTMLTIEPVQTWAYDTIYTITISKDAISLDGQTLGEDKKFTFQTIKYTGI